MKTATLKIPPDEFDHHQGSLWSPIILVEYGDFECPYCALAEPTLERIKDEFADDMCFVYRHFPLIEIHPHAELAALATEAADQQSRFWQMHDLLFENQELLSSDMIISLAETLGLNMRQFQDDMQREDLLARVWRDFNGGVRSGVNGTPTLFLNNSRFESAPSYDLLKAEIEKKLKLAS